MVAGQTPKSIFDASGFINFPSFVTGLTTKVDQLGLVSVLQVIRLQIEGQVCLFGVGNVTDC